MLPRGRLARIVWTSDAYIYAIEVSGRYRPGYPKFPKRVSLAHVSRLIDAGTCQQVPESIRLAEMALPDEALSDDQRNERDTRYELIAPLVDTPRCLEEVLNERTRYAVISRRALEAGTTSVRLKRTLSHYWWFGCDRNALLSRRSAQGGRGARAAGQSKRGRPNAIALLQRREQTSGTETDTYVVRRTLPNAIGVNASARHHQLFERAIHTYYLKQNYNYVETYDAMCRDMYVQWTRDSDGKKRRFPVDPAFIPSINQFRKYAAAYVRAQGLAKEKVGDTDYQKHYAPITGNVEDITCGPTDIYDGDVGVLKIQVVTDDVHRQPLGLVSVLFMADRGSHAIVAFFDYIGPESTAVYKLGLFWALVGPKAYLEAIGYKGDAAKTVSQWGAGGFCSGPYYDRGPGRSQEGKAAIVGRLGFDRDIAPPQSPWLKGLIESLIGKIQRKVAILPGGYNRRGGDRNQDQRDEAAYVASVPRSKLRDVIVSVVAEHNRFHAVPQLLTAQMAKDGVRPHPIDIFRWGEKYVRARKTAPFSIREIYLNLLKQDTVSASRSGVRSENMRFTSPEYERFLEANVGKKGLTVTICKDGTDPNRRYLLKEDGSVSVLHATLQTARKYDSLSYDEAKLQQERDRADQISADRKRRKGGLLRDAQVRAIAENAGFEKRFHKKPKTALARKVQAQHDALSLRTFGRGLLDPDFAPDAAGTSAPATSQAPASTNDEALSPMERAALEAARRLRLPDDPK